MVTGCLRCHSEARGRWLVDPSAMPHLQEPIKRDMLRKEDQSEEGMERRAERGRGRVPHEPLWETWSGLRPGSVSYSWNDPDSKTTWTAALMAVKVLHVCLWQDITTIILSQTAVIDKNVSRASKYIFVTWTNIQNFKPFGLNWRIIVLFQPSSSTLKPQSHLWVYFLVLWSLTANWC